jgi:uncharacterized membrane protein
MKKNNPLDWQSRKGVLLIFSLIIIAVVLLLLTAGQPHYAQLQPTITSITPSITLIETHAAPDQQPESDFTNGIILAGALLIFVIIMGTLHATRGLRKPS